MNTKKCYAKDYCKGYGTPKCTERCDFWWKLNTLYNKSNLPMRYRYNIPLRPEQIDREAFLKLKDYLDNVVDRVDNGVQYIHSRIFQTSKTTRRVFGATLIKQGRDCAALQGGADGVHH